MKKNKLLIMALSLILCLTVSIGIAIAYFTDYESAQGGAVLHLGGRTEIEEQADNDKKVVTIKNTGDVDMVVRVMFFGGNQSGANYKIEPKDNTSWSGAEGTWYYKKILKPGESTDPITASVEGNVKDGEHIDFDITVVHEGSRVTYSQDEDGKNIVAAPSGWDGFPVIAAESDGE